MYTMSNQLADAGTQLIYRIAMAKNNPYVAIIAYEYDDGSISYTHLIDDRPKFYIDPLLHTTSLLCMQYNGTNTRKKSSQLVIGPDEFDNSYIKGLGLTLDWDHEKFSIQKDEHDDSNYLHVLPTIHAAELIIKFTNLRTQYFGCVKENRKVESNIRTMIDKFKEFHQIKHMFVKKYSDGIWYVFDKDDPNVFINSFDLLKDSNLIYSLEGSF